MKRSDAFSPLDRLPEKIASRINMTEGCWYWIGTIDRKGYGTYFRGVGKTIFGHRMVWEALVGPVPDGFHIDHECHNADPTCRDGASCLHRRCVRPDHLAAVPALANVKNQIGTRLTHCKSGHEFTPDNTYRRGGTGPRTCRKCGVLNTRRYLARKAKAG